MKNTFIAFLFLITISACGYSMIGFNNEVPVKYYINTVINDTIDSTLGDLMQLETERFFLKYNELASYKNATYFMDINIRKLNYDDPILSSTNQASSTHINYVLNIVVTDIEGKEIYTYNTSISTSFSITSSITDTLQRRDDKLKDEIEDTLNTFRLNINKKVY